MKPEPTSFALWIALGLDPLDQVVTVLGAAAGEDEAKAAFSRAGENVVYRRAFNLTAPTFVESALSWLRGCGVPSSEARDVVREIGRQLQAMLKDEQP